ncbi:UNVERIFIED_CONTAM: hypothetical protein PYX00_006088 [Menopon gallinae]|uniref:Uncharacterized protein n=1 Tax=Menopon gallinae TaxID=328185 RepID=A0AAW2HU72_9NEOP
MKGWKGCLCPLERVGSMTRYYFQQEDETDNGKGICRRLRMDGVDVPSTWKAVPDLQQQVLWMDAEILAVGKNKHRTWFVGRASDGDRMSIRFSMLYAAAVLLMTMKDG